ncbi:serine protease [Alkalihalobacillus sp. 1P02AB]|uniref:serine protease n=1 Tax=Alkalihalobacillus sp. 1P02AB TaxID=3132260 RepID=UPI0039A520B9
MNQLKATILGYQSSIKELEKLIEQIQGECDHHYSGDTYMVQCDKCEKVKILYY